jgi:DNA repair protein SbcD/Mre11
MKFAHLGDCHLGCWRQPELQHLNMRSFQYAIDVCIKEKVDFVLIAGDLFDSAYPPIEIIKDAFNELRKLKEAKIPVYLIAGSHDYSASGKTFLDVMEKAGLAKNVFSFEERNGHIILHPTIHKNVAIYGYPGKKSGLEGPDIERIKIHDAPGLFKILMLHTAIRDAVGTLPIPAVDQEKLPKVDYLALAHLHINYSKNSRVYSGATFPANASELEEFQGGSFYIFNSGRIDRREIKLKEVIAIKKEITDALSGTDEVIEELKKHDLKDKILILRVYGSLLRGKTSDINFKDIEDFAKDNGAYVVLKNSSRLQSQESEIRFEIKSEDIEGEIMSRFQEENPGKFNEFIPQLVHFLQVDKKEEEKAAVFGERIFSEAKRIFGI